jgi:hypothetical protein
MKALLVLFLAIAGSTCEASVACGQSLHAGPGGGGVLSLDAVNVEIAQPVDCAWREMPQKPGNAIRLFACVRADNQVPVNLMVDDRDFRSVPPDRYFEPIRQGFNAGMQKLGGTLKSFSYARYDVGAGDAYRYEAEGSMSNGSLFTFGYVQFYDRAYAVQGASRSKEEPPLILATAESIRLLSAVEPPGRSAERAGAAFEILVMAIALLAAAYVWSQRKRRSASSEPPPNPGERGPGVRF